MNKLTDFERYVIEDKGTEPPFTGEYTDLEAEGVYLCKKCDAPLYRSEHKFHSHCGWPSFDDQITGAVTRVPDVDGMRIEIICSNCDGHLGHVFEGERLTDNNIRHCVNSVSMKFEPIDRTLQSQPNLATFGGGCFWCTEAVYNLMKGVISVTSGYSGGAASEANYRAVCSGSTGHAEVVQLEYDPNEVDFKTLLQVFFQSHDPTSYNQQGNDIGPQYRSVIFAHNAGQAAEATEVIRELDKSLVYPKPIVTELTMFDRFYPAENIHQDYYELHGEQPYCQMVVRPKVEKFKRVFADKVK
ncbi:bifunctional methionine sulfoxide reductase B/A protein [Shewanella sp. 202IG2-18]|uniref:bifunctional methionine sulfoxide reductase B/A protein n=1 Tax=Parashewanella hymeniacidonis TaxID=2807618 RepID=UPI0019605D75|nr:bifunctional methionine sulfoxide reductase B/A protein [Parashewanella hymeniacidonis]MBM7074152.1 bifunctional methionine sulfoxide reductase B/A protein [Parashewanella hymeniacidonis]